MALATLDELESIKATEVYQKQLQAVYNTIEVNKYKQLSVLVDFNAYGDAVLELLPHSKLLKPETLKRIHHSFEDDLVLIDIRIQTVQGQRQIEQLLAIAMFENIYDIPKSPKARSVCLWLFEQPITDHLLLSLSKMGRTIDHQSNKQRYLRYWDPRVLPIMEQVWTQIHKIKIKEVGINSIDYVDLNNEFVTLKLPVISQVLKTQESKRLFYQMKQPPFYFTGKQWSVLIQVEWINMVLRQLKQQIRIDAGVYKIVANQALEISLNKVSKQLALINIAKLLENKK